MSTAPDAQGAVSPDEILRGYDPFAQAALEPFGFSSLIVIPYLAVKAFMMLP